MSQRDLFEFFMGSGFEQGRSSRAVWHPPTDVYEVEGGAVVIIEVAGMAGGEFSLILQNRTLVITGHREDANEKQTYRQMEIHYGEFRSEVELPWPVDVDRIETSYSDGFFKVILRKIEPKRIPVRSLD
jgi:HSP20 family molecular chaperone IbpA